MAIPFSPQTSVAVLLLATYAWWAAAPFVEPREEPPDLRAWEYQVAEQHGWMPEGTLAGAIEELGGPRAVREQQRELEALLAVRQTLIERRVVDGRNVLVTRLEVENRSPTDTVLDAVFVQTVGRIMYDSKWGVLRPERVRLKGRKLAPGKRTWITSEYDVREELFEPGGIGQELLLHPARAEFRPSLAIRRHRGQTETLQYFPID